MARYTIQPLYLNKSDDEARRITTYYGRFAAPFDVRLSDSDETLLKGKTFISTNYVVIKCILLKFFVQYYDLPCQVY
jgi:hypothetical protein